MQLIRILPFVLASLMVTASAQTPPAKTSAADLVKQSEAALRDGKHERALTLAKQALASTPRSFAANHQAGVVSDLLGRYTEARKYFTRAIEIAPTPQTKATGRRSMAISYAFENNCKESMKYEAEAYNDYLETKDFVTASEVAYEAGDICLEAGDYQLAMNWYSSGRAATREQRNATPERRLLWNLREAHARARLAARRGHNAVALKHLSNVKALLAKEGAREHAAEYPYLAGYIAFYDDNYKAALPRLQAANQSDPSVLNLLAQTYETLGNQAQATECYRKVSQINAHDPAIAIARPVARSKLASAKR